MSEPKQQGLDFDALVQWARDNKSYGVLNSLVEDGPDNVTDFAGLLTKFTEKTNEKAQGQNTTDIL